MPLIATPARTFELASAIAEIEMIGIALAQVGRTPLPASDNVAASGHRNGIVEAEIAILLAHAAPVQRGEGCRHSELSNSRPQFQSHFHFAGKCSTALSA